MNNSTPQFSMCSINICGFSDRSKFMLNKYEDLKGYDVVAMQETGTDDPIRLELANMISISDSNKASNRGAALYIKHCHTLTKVHSIGDKYKNIDSVWGLGVINNNRYIIGSVYLKLNYTKGIDEIINMLNTAQQMTTKLKAEGVILLGDFNARHQIWGDIVTNQYGRNLREDLDATKFSITTAVTPTFLSANGASFIDLAIISNKLMDRAQIPVTDNEVELFSGAPGRGHVPLILHFSGTLVEHSNTIERTSIKNINWENWSGDLENKIDENSEHTNNMSDPYELLSNLDSFINEITLKHGERVVSTNYSKPYWTSKLSRLSTKLREARKSWLKRNTDLNKERLDEALQIFEEARKDECQKFILDKTSNLNAVQAQKFWKEFKKMFTPRKKQGIDPLDDGKGGLTTDNKEIEKELFSTFFEGKHLSNKHFDEEFAEEVNRIYDEVINNDYIFPQTQEQESLNAEVTLQEIEKCIKDLNTSGKSPDHKDFHPLMLKHFGPKAIKLLQKIFNICFSEKLWIWDNCEVIFLKKEGKKSYSVPGSYRPISITSYLGKLFESIIAHRIISFLIIKHCTDPDQEGFTEGRNPIRYLNRLCLGIKSDILEEKTCIGLFMDLEKAFDSIWQKGLIVKLDELGIQGNILKLINSFLTSRKVRLNVNGMKGEERDGSEIGVPQGSVLSPLLFKIYMMDLLDDVKTRNDVVIYKFADDGTAKITANTTAECLETVQIVLNSVKTWAFKWRMVVNCDKNKTEILCFNTAENNRDLIPSTFKLGDTDKINVVNQTIVLGLLVDDKLSFSPHADMIYNKLVTKWAIICHSSNRHWGFTQRVMCQLLKTLFLSTMLYGSHIWMSPDNMKEINKFYYKMLKSSIGAVFNVRKSLAETILGIPPIHIQNTMNQIKHYLKLNINIMKYPNDRLHEFISQVSQSIHIPASLQIALKQVFKFLQWKCTQLGDHFTDRDREIVEQRDISAYCTLSEKSCTYTKGNVRKYTEILWMESIRNEYLCEGLNTLPLPRCQPLPLNTSVSRECEVLLMSLLYENNLMNGFLHRLNRKYSESPLCYCGEAVQTSAHIIFDCTQIPEESRCHALLSLQDVIGTVGLGALNTTHILNGIRDRDFLHIVLNILYLHGDNLRKSIEL